VFDKSLPDPKLLLMLLLFEDAKKLLEYPTFFGFLCEIL